MQGRGREGIREKEHKTLIDLRHAAEQGDVDAEERLSIKYNLRHGVPWTLPRPHGKTYIGSHPYEEC